jgi:hypothetical protein
MRYRLWGQRHHEPGGEVTVVHVAARTEWPIASGTSSEQARRGRVLRHPDGSQHGPNPKSSGRTGARLRARPLRAPEPAAWPASAGSLPAAGSIEGGAARTKTRCRRA